MIDEELREAVPEAPGVDLGPDGVTAEEMVGRVIAPVLVGCALVLGAVAGGWDVVVVSAPATGGRVMGWPAAEHWRTTSFDTAVWWSIGGPCNKDERQGRGFHTALIGSIAVLLHAWSHDLHHLWLRAMTGEVEEARASIILERADEAVQLRLVSLGLPLQSWPVTYRTLGKVG